jgi:hypothetical protein
MAVDTLAKGLMALENDETRSAFAKGDFSSLGDGALTEEEASLLKGAAEDDVDSEVEAFSTSPTFMAVSYVNVNQSALSPSIHAQFGVFVQSNFAGVGLTAFIQIGRGESGSNQGG